LIYKRGQRSNHFILRSQKITLKILTSDSKAF
jgi:hypothetical protein